MSIPSLGQASAMASFFFGGIVGDCRHRLPIPQQYREPSLSKVRDLRQSASGTLADYNELEKITLI